MAGPAAVSVATTWTLVAQNVETGVVYKIDNGPMYHQTWVDTGDAAPTGNEGFATPIDGDRAYINSPGRPIDVYLKCSGSGTPGYVRVDI